MEQINKTKKQIRLEQMFKGFNLNWGEIETHYWVDGFESLGQLNAFREEMDRWGISGKERSSGWWWGIDDFDYSAENYFLEAFSFEFPKHWLK